MHAMNNPRRNSIARLGKETTPEVIAILEPYRESVEEPIAMKDSNV